jgi:hypothetical protein
MLSPRRPKASANTAFARFAFHTTEGVANDPAESPTSAKLLTAWTLVVRAPGRGGFLFRRRAGLAAVEVDVTLPE